MNLTWNEFLPLIFMAVMGLALLAYVILDGYDLGVGILLPFASDDEKDVMVSSIGPFWDANETWLVLGIGVLLVAFPLAHGIVLSALLAGCLEGRGMNRLQRARVGIGGTRGKLAGVLGYHFPTAQMMVSEAALSPAVRSRFFAGMADPARLALLETLLPLLGLLIGAFLIATTA